PFIGHHSHSPEKADSRSRKAIAPTSRPPAQPRRNEPCRTCAKRIGRVAGKPKLSFSSSSEPVRKISTTGTARASPSHLWTVNQSRRSSSLVSSLMRSIRHAVVREQPECRSNRSPETELSHPPRKGTCGIQSLPAGGGCISLMEIKSL